MKVFLKHQSILLIIALACSVKSFANDRNKIEPEGFLYGLGLAMKQEVYKDYGMRVVPIPVLGYRGKDLKIFGPFASYDIADIDNFSFSIKLAPRFAGYDQDDSDVFTGMDKRKSSMDGGVGIEYKRNNLRIDYSLMFDLLGNSNGTESSANVSYVWRFGRIFLEPSFGLKYQDSDLVNYYYGVRDNEANATRSQYSADHALNSKVEITATTPFLGGLTRIGITKNWYDSAIRQSPLVDINAASGISIFLSYSRFF